MQRRREAERLAVEKKLQEIEQNVIKTNGLTNGSTNKVHTTTHKKTIEYTENYYSNGGSELTNRTTKINNN